MPEVDRHKTRETSITIKKKRSRRSIVKRKVNKQINILYSNIQGVRGKKTSLKHVMETTDSDIVLLTETMVRNVDIEGCQCINPKVSVGQNVSIILAGRCCNKKKMKLYEPNDVINMMGLRLEVNNTGLRLYTAHMKQQSTTSRDDIKMQFDEIRNQFRSANLGREPMVLMCDANVHVGGVEIDGCEDAQDWGGKEFMGMLKDEGLTLINSSDLCTGVVTRIDPRNGRKSTIDLAVCNTFMLNKITKMNIDESGNLALKSYGKKVTQSDHNTITLALDMQHQGSGKVAKKRKYNTNNTEAREKMKLEISGDVVLDNLFRDQPDSVDVNAQVQCMFARWEMAMVKSFRIVTPSKRTRKGVDAEMKILLDREKWIRENILENPERGQKIADIQMLISEKIAEKLQCETEEKVNKIIQSERPQSKVFSVRRNTRKITNIDFPLKDVNGVVQVSREGIDKIITTHFKKVFAQNGVPRGEIWEEYWMCIDEVFDQIDQLTKNQYNIEDEPKYEEIVEIIKDLKEVKATYGDMTIDLVKLCGEKMVQVIYRCILVCFQKNVFPEVLQTEKMILILKNNGIIDNMNDYRGIFIRNIIVSVYQKWLYKRNAPVVDKNGTEYAFGGRTQRSGMEALLIVKLIQDYARWTKTPMIIKFLDVEKFFDSMNFKKSLIEAYLSGVQGRFWQCYKTINEKKICQPHIPSGKCSSIEMKEVFVQGSCDAVLMAWPIMDAESKRAGDPFATDCCIDGIPINQISFVDDLIELAKNENRADDRCLDNEVFEKKTRLNFKTSKCKAMPMNYKKDLELFIDNEKMEVVGDHVYLGTMVSKNGERVKDMQDRVKKTHSVANEIVQICKETELSKLRLRYVNLLMSACLDSKVKYRCALWNIIKSMKAVDDLNKIKPALLKRVLQLPSSTPSDAVLYEFGINDLSLEVLMEKVILAANTLNLDDERIAKRLLRSLLQKNVPGFCTEVAEACEILGVSLDELVQLDVRKTMKEKLIKLQAKELFQRMSLSSKMDKILLNGFLFDGKIKQYLLDLDFEEGRVVFMVRYRMLPTKNNFPGRWVGSMCNVCGLEDTDAHVFSCPGYQDLLSDDIWYDMFWDPSILKDTVKLKKAAGILLAIVERMEEIQDMVVDKEVSPN